MVLLAARLITSHNYDSTELRSDWIGGFIVQHLHSSLQRNCEVNITVGKS